MASFDQFANNFTANLNKALEQSFDRRYLTGVGDQIVNQIKVRTRAGFGVSSNGARQSRLRRLSTEYIETRRFARAIGLLAPTTAPARSNLTFSGRMLESINYRFSNNRLTFGFDNSDAERVATEVQTRGRQFFNLSSTEISKLTSQFNIRLRTFLLRV